MNGEPLDCEVCEALNESVESAEYWVPDEGVVVCEEHFESRQPVTSDVYRIELVQSRWRDKSMNETELQRTNQNAKCLKLGDGILDGPGGSAIVIEDRAKAVRAAIMRHREGTRAPLAIPAEGSR